MKKHLTFVQRLLCAAAFAGLVALPSFAQEDGKQIFENNCKTCHAIGEKVVGPDLKDVHKRRDEAWIKSFVKNSAKVIASGDKQAVAVFEENGKIPMPAFEAGLDDGKIAAVIGYIKAESEAPTVVAPPPTETNPTTPVAVKPFSLKDIPTEWLILGLVFGFLLLVILMMLGMLMVQLVPALAKTDDEKALEHSWAMRWLALLGGNTVALTGKAKDVLMQDHDYDGITEFDNDLPPWWKYTFYVSIFFGAVYMIYYHVTDTGKLMIDEYQQEMAAAALQQSQSEDDPNAKTSFAMLKASGDLEEGQKIFAQNCAACHGQKGEGAVGPNLTDEFWLHGGDVNEIYHTVKFGVPAKGMVAWQKKLSKNQILQVSSYILTLQGTNPTGGKEPQGEKVAMK